MHDFDSERRARHEEREKELGDRSFTFGGERFLFRANVHYSVIQSVAEIGENDSSKSVFTEIVEAVVAMVDPVDNGLERFRKVCAPRDEDPITWDDMTTLCNWLIEKTSNRPPTPPELSPPSPAGTGTSSTETPSTEPAAA